MSSAGDPDIGASPPSLARLSAVPAPDEQQGDARLGRIHPANAMLTREVVAKTFLGIALTEMPRWG